MKAIKIENCKKTSPEELKRFFHEVLQQHFPDRATLQEACGVTQESLETLYHKAYNDYSSGNYFEAEQYFAALIAFNPFQFKCWMGLAAAQQAEKKLEKATLSYAMAALLDDSDPTPHYHAAHCYLAQGNQADTMKALNYAEVRASKHPLYSDLRHRIVSIKEQLNPQGNHA